MVEYIIGIDSGTQSTKAVVVDRDSGKVVGSAVKRARANMVILCSWCT